MITKEQILEAQKTAVETSKPLREEFKKIKMDYDLKFDEIEKPVLDLIEIYYDENLRDKNDTPVKINVTITDGKSTYFIHNRGMQFMLGTILFNPRVMARKIDKLGFSKPNAREVHIHPSDLKKYWVI